MTIGEAMERVVEFETRAAALDYLKEHYEFAERAITSAAEREARKDHMAELYETMPLGAVVPAEVKAEVFRDVYDQWVAAGRPQASPRPKPLRLRIEPEGAAGPHWLTLLALLGWMRGVVDADVVGNVRAE